MHFIVTSHDSYQH